VWSIAAIKVFKIKEAHIIFTKFLKLEPEKQQRILNAAMKEFAQKGFKNASTEVIVKEADISKGALFYYFKNKKGLFLFLYDYALDILKDEILMKFNYEEKDIFERRKQAMLLKIEVLKKHPEMYDFLGAAYLEDSSEVKSELESRNKELMASGQGKLYEGIDTSKFKEDVDVKRAIEIISWTIDGFINKEREIMKSFPLKEVNQHEMLRELEFYLEMLKKSFYK
jgi:TetR/AcrR family transcriptional regulator